MAEYNFLQRKNDVLGKEDKSYAGEWDKHILKLCEKINKKENYYTTSSCSGRILLMVDKPKKGAGLFSWITHEKTTFEEIKKNLIKFSGKEPLKFKCEPPIIHIVCKTLKDAKEILDKGFKSGFKNSGVISFGKNIVVELHATEKYEFPIFYDKKILVDDNFLKIVVEKSNKKLEKGWKAISELEKKI